MTYFKLIVIALVLSLTALGGYRLGEANVTRAWNVDKETQAAAEAEAVLARSVEKEATVKRYTDEKLKMKGEYNAEIDIIRAGFAKSERLRFTKNTCKRLDANPEANSASGSDGGNAETWVFSYRVDADLKRFGQMIEEKIAACRVAQEFIRVNGMAP